MKLDRSLLCTLVGVLFAAGSPQSVGAEDKPSEIRVSYPGVGVGARPASHSNVIATLHLRGLLEEEFKKDGIAIRWSFLRGAGPAVNELFANNLVDFSHLGDLPSVIGRASGLSYRILLSSGVRNNLYVSVPSDSNVQSLKDLKGKRVALQKGTATHLAGLKILESAGLTGDDVKLVNMDTPAAQTALVTRDVDATIGSADYLRLRDQGVSRILFSTRAGDPKLTSNGTFLASQSFIQKYPRITQRVVNTVVKAAQWLATTPSTQIFQLWTKSGTTFSSFREDFNGDDFKYRTSPLLDSYVSARYKLQIVEAKRLNLVKNTFSYDEWIEPKFLQQALKELNLEGFWQQRGPDGKPVQPDTQRAAAAPATASTKVAELR
jgi:sulfonate transport system substrate-binding protein